MSDTRSNLTTGAVIGAGVGARKLTEKLWKRATGGEPPKDPTDSDTKWSEAIAWTLVVAVAVGLARLVARRLAGAAASR